MRFLSVWAGLLLAGVLVCGCTKDVGALDEADQAIPLLEKAAGKADEGEFASAVRLYTHALSAYPDAARGHLDVALILDTQLKDYVRAIYHYQRYLEERPETEKAPMIKERIRRAEQLFAATIIEPGQSAEKVAALKQDVSRLKKVLADVARERDDLRARLAQADAAARRSPDPAPPPVVRPTTYVVEFGDTLTSIAQDMYGDGSRWRDIQVANRSLLGRSDQVKVGQELKIP